LIPSLWTSLIFSFGLAILVAASGPQQRPDNLNKDVEPVVYVRREPPSGSCSLRVNSFRWQQAAPKPKVFKLISLWRYDPDMNKWVKERWNDATSITVQAHLSQTEQTLVALPAKIGLFWVKWSEDERPASSLAFSGPVLCEDIDIGEPPNGEIATCVPLAASAVAKFVPDPRTHCRD